MKIKILLLLCILCSVWKTAAQPERGVAVRVKNQQSGKIEDVKLYEGSYALIVGESDYTNGWDNLPGVKNDVVAVKTALEKQGFQVRTVLNPKSYDLTKAIEDFISDYGYIYGNRLLIYFAGHGHTQKAGDGRDLGYIIPSDAPLPEADALGFQRKAVSMDTIQFYARKIQAKHALFLFDSCFSGKLVSRSNVTVPPFIVANVGQSVRQFITSGAANQTVPDESDFRKLFVRALDGKADEDGDGFILGSELAKFLKRELTNYSSGRQTPQYGKILDVDLDQGDFVFVVPKTPVIAPTPSLVQVPSKLPTNTVASSQAETFFWQLIENSNDSKDFENYLNRVQSREFSGIYKPLAELKLNKIKSKNALIAWVAVSGLANSLKKYAWVSDFQEGMAIVSVEEEPEKYKYGFIDRNGRELIAPTYQYVQEFSEGLAVAQIMVGDKRKYGFIDRQGKVVIPFQYEQAKSFSDGLAPVGDGDFIDGNMGFINQNNTMFVPKQYGGAGVFRNGLAFVRRGSFFGFEYGFINTMGKEVIPLKLGRTNGFSDGVAVALSEENKALNSLALTAKDETKVYLVLNTKGEITAKLKGFEYVRDFQEGLAVAREKNGKLGFIDKSGAVVVPMIYDSLSDFDRGFAVFGIGEGKNMKLGLLDKNGNIVVSAKYERIWNLAFTDRNIYGVVKSGIKGFVDIYGNEYFQN